MRRRKKNVLRKRNSRLISIGGVQFTFSSAFSHYITVETNFDNFQWMDSTFNEVDYLPCTNAMQIESFMIGTQIFVAIANSMDENSESFIIDLKE